MTKKLFSLLIVGSFFISVNGQYTTLNAHSHNDYLQKIPFFLAYEHHFGSVEADIWTTDGDLLVAHEQKTITKDRSLDSMYLMPIVRLFRQNRGQAWKDRSGTFQLLIDVKSEVEPALKLLAEKVSCFPEVFDPRVNPDAVRIVITGNRPEPENFKNFPAFFFFDGKLTLNYSPDQLERVAMFSENLGILCSWRGKEPMSQTDRARLIQIIGGVHQNHRPIRFWNAPDDAQAWDLLLNLNVDYINTDHITELSEFLTSKNASQLISRSPQ